MARQVVQGQYPTRSNLVCNFVLRCAWVRSSYFLRKTFGVRLPFPFSVLASLFGTLFGIEHSGLLLDDLLQPLPHRLSVFGIDSKDMSKQERAVDCQQKLVGNSSRRVSTSRITLFTSAFASSMEAASPALNGTESGSSGFSRASWIKSNTNSH
jgi:hypothetical protein